MRNTDPHGRVTIKYPDDISSHFFILHLYKMGFSAEFIRMRLQMEGYTLYAIPRDNVPEANCEECN